MNSHSTDAIQDNILIVDDTPENLQVLSATLSRQGYKVRGVVNGSMALRVARSALPDLILLDIKMLDMNGYDVCKQLKADENTRDIPVIFISALDEVLDKIQAFKIGGVDYITKPFQVEEVLARVENQLTIRRLQKQLQEQNKKLQEEIKEREKAEKAAEAASKAKSEFLTNMSHELRTPLNVILGFTQVINRDSLLGVEQRENLRIISRSGEHLLELINDILELSKIEAGIIYLNESHFDLYHLLDLLEEMFLLAAEKKQLPLDFIIASDVPQYIRTDEKKLRSCLINILNNAIKFTQAGRVTLRVTVEGGEQESTDQTSLNPLHFAVEDTGCGIAPNEINNIFEAFLQTESGRKSAEGTGLGLTITRKFIQLMGGDITVSSVLGEGTTFKFNIRPKQADASGVSTTPLQKVIGLQPNQPTYRILIVDDTKDNRLLLVKLLQPIGFEVQEAENGQQTLPLWESWQPHLILMDTRMPVMDGLEATQQIRAREREMGGRGAGAQGRTGDSPVPITPYPLGEPRVPQSPISNPHTVIIALTASAFEEKRTEILAAGCDDFIHKPFTEAVLFAKIAEYLGVRYLYEDLPQTGSTSRYLSSGAKPDSFFLPKLAAMPRSWVQSLYQAANEVNEELTLQLIEQIRENSAPLAEALTDLFEDAHFDTIVRLTQAILE